MGYYIDLQKISIDRYKAILKSADLLPSWMILKENIDENMERIKQQNIRNLDELKKSLKTKEHVLEFSKRSGLAENYLGVLRRVINGYHPKPNRIKDFPGIAEDVIVSLGVLSIKNTKQLYDEILTKEKRDDLSHRAGISSATILRLTKLTDLSRIRWVNHTFAYVLLEAGYETAKDVADADYRKMYETIKQLNEERKIYNAHIGAHDMKLVVEAANRLEFEIEFNKE